MNEILLLIVKTVIILAITIVMRYIVPLVKEKVEESKFAWLAKWIDKAVLAAEQIITDSKSGAERKAMVVELIKKLLVKKNISLSDEQLDTLIEAAVWTMKNVKEDK